MASSSERLGFSSFFAASSKRARERLNSGLLGGSGFLPEFERSLARLEEVAKKLENANLSLDEAMKLFEEGVQLSRDCQKQLEEAEGRVEILLKMADGKMAAEPFEPEAEEES